MREAGADWRRLILPRLSSKGLSWYAIARDAREARVLREELIAFVGPSYSGFEGQFGALDPADPVERAVHVLAPLSSFRLEVVDLGLKNWCREALRRLLEVRGRMPRGTRGMPRAPGRVLRDFELAVQSRARAEARGYLEELRAQGGASARNLLFLEVYLHESFDEWDALGGLLEDGALVQARRPARVTRGLIRAVYRRQLAGFEAAGRAREALAHFVEEVQPRYGRLYMSLAGLDGPEVTKSFLLLAAAVHPRQAARRDVLLERYPVSAPDRRYVEALARLVPTGASVETAGNALDEARAAFAGGDLDGALEVLSEAEPSPAGLELVIRCAIEIGSLDAAVEAIAAVKRAPEEVRRKSLDKPRVRRSLSELLERFDTAGVTSVGADSDRDSAPPRNWLEWIERVRREPEWLGALPVAQQGALEWSVEEAARSPAELQAFAEALLSDLPGSSAETLLDALPHLLEFFVQRAESSRVFTRVQAALLDRLLYLEARSIESIRASGVLLDALIRGGIDPEECERVVEDLLTVWREQPSFDLLDWALDVLDSLVTVQSVPHEKQLAFATALRGELVRWRDRITPGQVALYRQLCREGDFPFEARDFESSEESVRSQANDVRGLLPRISGRVVALYSMRAEVLKRTREVLLSVAPDVDVRLFGNEVGTNALRVAARTADVFVIVTGAAKHAATEFIEAHRPKDAVTLRCHGTGAGSLLRTLERG